MLYDTEEGSGGKRERDPLLLKAQGHMGDNVSYFPCFSTTTETLGRQSQLLLFSVGVLGDG